MTTTNRSPERGPRTAETSFIEGAHSEQVLDANSLKIETTNEIKKQDYPKYGENGKFLTLEVEEGKVFVVGPRGGKTPLFLADGKTINPKISKTDMKILGPHRSEVIQQNDEEIQLTDEEIAEIEKAKQEDTMVANDENEEPAVRERAREKIREKNRRKNPA